MKKNINNDFEEMFKVVCNTNDDLIKSKETIVPVCVFFKQGEEPVLHVLNLNSHNKAQVISDIKDCVKTNNVDAYVLIVPGHAVTEDKVTREQYTNKCIVRTLYTKQTKISSLAWYKDGRILGRERLVGRQGMDAWDFYTQQIVVTINLDAAKKKTTTNKDKDNNVNVDRFKYKTKNKEVKQ